MNWTDLHQIFRIVTHCQAGSIRPYFRNRYKGRYYGNQFFPQIGEFCVLAFHNGWEDHNMDARVNAASDPSTSDKKVGELCSSNPWGLLARLPLAGYTLGFATHFWSFCVVELLSVVSFRRRVTLFIVNSVNNMYFEHRRETLSTSIHGSSANSTVRWR